MHIINRDGFATGYNDVIKAKDYPFMDIDFGVLELEAGKEFCSTDCAGKEWAFQLVKGEVDFRYCGKTVRARRDSTFDDGSWVLHVPAGTDVEIQGVAAKSEIACYGVMNEKFFEPRLYTPDDCSYEERGKTEVEGVTHRLVSTFFEYATEPNSNLVLGEVIVYPGRWTTFPPHIHEQPELYYYKFQKPEGYGFCEENENVYKVYTDSTILLDHNTTHPQTAAPGYPMWYSWAIRNLEGNPWTLSGFLPEYLWIKDKDAKLWDDSAAKRIGRK